MKTLLKVLGGLVMTVVALMVIVPMALGGKIGDIVKAEANKMLNAKVEFSSLDISLFRHFPKASLELKEISVTGVAPFEGETLVAAGRIEVVVDLMSIFGESFEVRKVVLNRPEIRAHVLADGSANWDIMKPSDEPEAEQVEEVAEDDADSAPFRLALTDLRINGGKIYYTDESAKIHLHVNPLDVALGGNLSADVTTVKTDISAGDITFISDSQTLAAGITATLRAAVKADLANSKFTLSDNLLTVNSIKARLDGWVQMEGDDIVTDITLDCSDNNFKEILSVVPALYTKDFEDLSASGDVSLTAWVKGRMSGDNYPAFALELAVDNGEFKYAALPKSVSEIAVTLAVKNGGGELDNTLIDLSRFGASLGGQRVGATLKASTPLSDLAFEASVNGALDLGSIKEIYPLDEGMALGGKITADLSAAGRMSQIERGEFDKMQTAGTLGVENITVTLASLPQIAVDKAFAEITPKRASLDELSIRIGRSDISAKGHLTNYWGYLLHDTTLGGRLSVKSSLIDANELMAGLAGEEEEAAKAEEAATETPADTEQAPLEIIEVPENLDLALDCSLKKVLFQKMEIDNFKGTITVKGGTMSLDELSMNMFDGSAKASASYSTTDKKNPKVALDASFSNASFKTTFEQVDLMQSIAPVFESIDGTYSMQLAAAMQLDKEMNPVLSSVNGNGKISSGNLKLSNIKALQVLSKTLGDNTLNDLQVSEPTLISFTIRDGALTTNPFDIKIGKTKLNLAGSTYLDTRIDYNATVYLPDNLTAYAKIGGTFSSPTVKLDTKRSLEAALESAGITKESVKESINAELTKQADNLVAEAQKAGERLVAEAQKQKQNMVAKASNAFAKIAAEKAGDLLVKEAQKQADNLVAEARKKADELLSKQ